jgi:mono/diheme cytochrome c family protein
MRERIARAVATLFVTVLLALSVVFARAQDPEGASAQLPHPDSPDTARGRLVYEERGCARCHSVLGVGSTQNPLDGVGSRRAPAELLAWTVGDEILADSLSPSTWRAKQAHREIAPEDLEALVAWLSGLVEGRPAP